MQQALQAIYKPLHQIAGDAINPYFLGEGHFASPEKFPHNVHPLAFLPYNEETIIERIKTLGWVKPDDTDPNSSNCLLNAYANHIHRQRYSFHPYVWEIANMVREGVMTREEGLDEMRTPGSRAHGRIFPSYIANGWQLIYSCSAEQTGRYCLTRFYSSLGKFPSRDKKTQFVVS